MNRTGRRSAGADLLACLDVGIESAPRDNSVTQRPTPWRRSRGRVGAQESAKAPPQCRNTDWLAEDNFEGRARNEWYSLQSE